MDKTKCADCGATAPAHYLSCLTYLAWVHRHDPDVGAHIQKMRESREKEQS